MNGIALLVAISSLGVDYSWRTTAEGDVEYVLQVETGYIQPLLDGEEIHSDVPAEVGKAQRVVLRIDTKELPKSAADVQRARAILRGQSRANGEYPTVLWRAGKPPEETTAITYGWQPDAKGQLLYYLQVDPALLKTLNSGDEIHAIVRPEAGRVATFAVAAGVKQLPRIAGGSTTTAPAQPATAGSPATQPATSPSSSAYDNSGRRRFNSASDPATSPDPGRASTARTGTTPSSDPPLYSPRTNDSPAARSSTTDSAGSRPRPRWSSTDVPADSNTQPIQPTQPQPETRPGYTYGPQAAEPKPESQRDLYPAPASTYPPSNSVQTYDDPQRRAEMESPRFDTPRDFSTTGNYQPTPDNRIQPSAQNDYRNQAGAAPFSGSQPGYEYSQPPQDRTASRNPNVPLGTSRPLAQEPYPITAPTPTAFPSTVPPSAPPAVQPTAIPPAPDAKPASQPLSVWTLLWCLVFFSVGGNLYLGWTAAEFYSRYKLATERLRSGSASR